MANFRPRSLSVFACLLVCGLAEIRAQTRLGRSIAASGGGVTFTREFRVRNTIGQAIAGISRNGAQEISHGFWYGRIYSAASTSRTEPGIGGDDAALRMRLACVPNPTSGNATITFSAPGGKMVKLCLFGSNGKAIRTLFSGISQQYDRRDVGFNTAQLPSGSYLLLLESDGDNCALPLVVVH